MSLALYTVDPKYAAFMREADYRVSYTEKGKSGRPFLGIVLSIAGHDYFAPLTSPKPRHEKMSNAIDFIKMGNGKDAIGAINLNNMIPVPMSLVQRVNPKIQYDEPASDVKYKILLQKQYAWCDRNEGLIRATAERLYGKIVTGKGNRTLRQRCCDFKACERRMDEYCRLHGLAQPKPKARDDRKRPDFRQGVPFLPFLLCGCAGVFVAEAVFAFAQ